MQNNTANSATSGWRKRLTSTFLLAVAALLPFAPLEQSQAQLIISVYPSQDNPTTQTIWIFSGSSTASQNWSIRTSGSYASRDSWESDDNSGNFFDANQPGKTNWPLSFFLASAHLQAMEAIRKGMLGKGRPPILWPTIIHKMIMGFASARTICSTRPIWLLLSGNSNGLARVKVNAESLPN